MNFKWKIGDIARIKNSATSNMGHLNKGCIIVIISTNPSFDKGYSITDIPRCSGVWFDELEPVGLVDDDFEDV